jgi:sarcosine oxidase
MAGYDIVVVGGGAMGAASACAAAQQGASVALVERWAPGHDRGSSHGNARIFRLAYPEAHYVTLARQALPLWRALEERTCHDLLTTTGGLDHGPGPVINEISWSLARSGVGFAEVTAEAAGRRWPGMRLDEAALYQPDAGRIDADAAVAALHELAEIVGVTRYLGEPAVLLREVASGVEVVTAAQVLSARVAVVAAGAWTPGLLAPLELGDRLPALHVTQEQPGYFPTTEQRWPAFVHYRDGVACYGLAAPGLGLKVGEHGGGPVVDPDDRPPADPDRRARLEDYVAHWLPGAAPVATAVETCLYTNSPDANFVLARLGAVVVCSACSGHGFKFVPAIGRITADLALAG